MDEGSGKHCNLDPPPTTSLPEDQISTVRVRRLSNHLPSADGRSRLGSYRQGKTRQRDADAS